MLPTRAPSPRNFKKTYVNGRVGSLANRSPPHTFFSSFSSSELGRLEHEARARQLPFFPAPLLRPPKDPAPLLRDARDVQRVVLALRHVLALHAVREVLVD